MDIRFTTYILHSTSWTASLKSYSTQLTAVYMLAPNIANIYVCCENFNRTITRTRTRPFHTRGASSTAPLASAYMTGRQTSSNITDITIIIVKCGIREQPHLVLWRSVPWQPCMSIFCPCSADRERVGSGATSPCLVRLQPRIHNFWQACLRYK